MRVTPARCWVVTALLAVCAASGCRNPAGPSLLVEPIQIDSVDVIVMATLPPTVAAHVRGVIGDGCSELHSVQQQRSGHTITITILRKRPKAAICTQVARLYDERIPLEGSFPAGDYLLRVNDVERRFQIQYG